MTAVCGGGTSSARAGFGASLALTASSIAALLNNIPTVWAVPLAGYLGLLTYNLSEFCSTDPPAVPDITAEDVINIISIANPIAHTQALQKLADLVGAYAWYSVCQCDSVATPSPPAAPDPPDDMPSINPPSVAPYYPTGTPCQVLEFGGHFPDVAFYASPLYPLGSVTYAECDFTASIAATSTGQFGFNFRWYNASNVQIVGSATLITGIDTTAVIPHDQDAKPSTATQYQIGWGDGPPVTDEFDWHATIRLYCGTEPGNPFGPVPTPCPVDPIAQAMLAQILELVTLIQRQAVPFAYVERATHTGITGSGSIDVQGLIGMKILLVSPPVGGAGVAEGDPDRLWTDSWINWGTPDGVTALERIESANQLSMPPAGGVYTKFHYSLADGVEVDFVELAREP